MMPTCGYLGMFKRRCQHVAEHDIGEIVLPNEKDGFGKPWKQPHYLCEKHHRKLLDLLGFSS